MVSCSGFAHGVCLGRSANSGIYWIGNWGKQHERRSEHNNKQHLYAWFSEQHGGWISGCCRQAYWQCSRSNERDYGWAINHQRPEQ